MPIATWTDDLLTGIDVIGAQHRALFESVEGLSLDMEYAAYSRSEVPA